MNTLNLHSNETDQVSQPAEDGADASDSPSCALTRLTDYEALIAESSPVA